MRRVGGLIERVVSADNMRLAWLKTIRGKRTQPRVLRFRERLDENLREIAEDLREGRYRWGDFERFTIYDPKEREIKVASLRDRIAHHALIGVCEPYFDRVQFAASCACRRDRGSSAAVDLAERWTRSSRFFLKNDVRKYFDSISHDVLKEQTFRLFKDDAVLKAFFDLIDGYESSPGRGVPIGSLTSQFFANHYLNGLDRFVFETLKIPRYVRYMDDFVLWSDSRAELVAVRRRIEEFVAERLKLELKPSVLNQSRFGLSFLGFSIRDEGVFLTRRSKKRYWRAYGKAMEKLAAGEWDEAEVGRRLTASTAFVKRARSRSFLTRVLNELGN